ncbi:hypothetical protein [uncultured Cohaesibacter sp.]|uniref:hypothetical protein n=1 Tax=uncultured Cohaesibacter sp. TaxID=1002546 RepID=UPI0029C66B84|nr:hypothetical protein [uncultured Cohaesibacter sp.]
MMNQSYPALLLQGSGQINAACYQEIRLVRTANVKMKRHSTISGLKNRLEGSLRRQIGATKAPFIANP